MNNRYFQLFVLLFVIGLLGVSFPASAQTQIAGNYSGLDHINRIIAGTPGVTSVAVTGAVNASATGTVNFRTPYGLNVPIPTTITGKVTSASIAAAAGRMGLRFIPYVGAAVALKDITDAVAKEGWKTCPPPQFFCKSDTNALPDPTAVQGHYVQAAPGSGPTANQCRTSADNCGYVAAATAYCTTLQQPAPDVYQRPYGSGVPSYSTSAKTYTYYFTCTQYDNLRTVVQSPQVSCPSGYTLTNSQCVQTGYQYPILVAGESELQTALNNQFAQDAAMIKRMYDQQRAVELANPGAPPLIPAASVALTMTAAPVTTPVRQVSQETTPNPDGVGTQTKTVTQQTTITPTIPANATAAAPGITYPSSTVTTTTVVNNETNVTNITSTTEVTQPENLEKPEPLPKDYNRESTQLRVLDELTGTNAPAAPAAPTIAADMTKGQQDLDKQFTDLPATINDSKSNWFSWVWSPTIGQCNESDYSGSVRGYAVNIGVCELVDKFREVCGFLWAMIGALSIYSQIFKPRSEA